MRASRFAGTGVAGVPAARTELGEEEDLEEDVEEEKWARTVFVPLLFVGVVFFSLVDLSRRLLSATICASCAAGTPENSGDDTPCFDGALADGDDASELDSDVDDAEGLRRPLRGAKARMSATAGVLCCGVGRCSGVVGSEEDVWRSGERTLSTVCSTSNGVRLT